MIAVKATYDGHDVKLPLTLAHFKPQKVIVTFLESDGLESDEMAQEIAQSVKFSFLEKDSEDIYSDQDLKIIF